jgi:ubiquinone/menaquinone biosynthesis C-methylase UbiE
MMKGRKGKNTKEGIRKAYDGAAADYAEKWWNEFEDKHFDRIILDWFASKIPKGERVLELGAGPGEVSGYLAERGVSCLGTDYSGEMVRNGKKFYPAIAFEVQDFLALTYPNDSFFALAAFYAIVNLGLDDVARMLGEFKRVMKR